MTTTPNRSTTDTRCDRLLRDDDGMSTVEYAIGTVAAAAFAAVLYAVVSGDSIVGALTDADPARPDRDVLSRSGW